jgi:hypothetical protein
MAEEFTHFNRLVCIDCGEPLREVSFERLGEMVQEPICDKCMDGFFERYDTTTPTEKLVETRKKFLAKLRSKKR